MNSLLVNLALCLLASDFMTSAMVLEQDRPSYKCKPSKALSLVQMDCSRRDFHEIPSNLDTNIQVMDFSHNRLRKLSAGMFSRYSNLEYLYLGHNVILEMGKESVAELPYLQALDLTDNVLMNLPIELFQLSYLRRLYLTRNELKDDTFATEVKSPLELLEVVENHLTKIPAIGPQPGLTNLSLSRNGISKVSTEDLAHFCSLRILDLTKNPIKFDPSTCDCYHFNSWINIRNINVKPSFPCNNATFESCMRVPFSNKTMEYFEKCLDIIKVQVAAVKAKSTWIIIGCCVGAFIVCAMIGFYYRHRQNKRRNRKLKAEQRLAANNANTELLNSNLPDQLSVKTLHE